MAKQRQLHTLDRIESRLGYKVDYINNADEGTFMFYSDLTPVSRSPYEKALRELDKQRCQRPMVAHDLLDLDVPNVSQHVALSVVQLSYYAHP